MASPKCPVCGASVRTENLSKHLQSVHPREAKPEMVLEAERKATQTVRPPPPRSFSASLPRNVIIVVLILALIAGGAWVVATSPAYSAYTPDTPVTQMCIEHSALIRHDHTQLSIDILGAARSIPDNVGRTTCMRPLHTHVGEPGRIHIESPVVHEFTLGDFFLVWGPTFSSNNILGYTTNSNHRIVMRVDGVVNTEYDSYVLPHGTEPTVTISYEQF